MHQTYCEINVFLILYSTIDNFSNIDFVSRLNLPSTYIKEVIKHVNFGFVCILLHFMLQLINDVRAWPFISLLSHKIDLYHVTERNPKKKRRLIA